MKPSDIRKELHKYVDEADNETLHFAREAIIVYWAKKQKSEDKKADLIPPLRPMTDEELCVRIEQSEENLKNGKYLTEKQMDSFISKLNARA